MHFSDTAPATSTKATKIATVVAIHVVLGYGLIQSMSTINYSKPIDRIIELVPTFEPPKEKLPEPEPPKVKQKVVEQTPVVPKTEVLPTEQVESPIVVEAVENPPAQPPAPAVANPGPAVPAAEPGNGIRTAVFAEGCATPEYPTSSLRNGEEGTTILALMVNAAGSVESARVTKSSGSRALDRAAQTALSLCKFKPAMANGQPESGWAQISYVWKLES
jgi:protein TonB